MTAEQTRILKHELRTPINHIIGYSDLLAEAAGDERDDAVELCARTIQKHGDTLASLVDRHFARYRENELDGVAQALGGTATPLIRSIQQIVDRASSFDGMYSSDFQRIQVAIRKLEVLLYGEGGGQ